MKNGLKRLIIGITTIFVTSGVLTLIGYVIANDSNSRERDTEITTDYREADKLMTERNTEAFQGQMEATNELKVSVGKLDVTIDFLGKQLEKIANGR